MSRRDYFWDIISAKFVMGMLSNKTRQRFLRIIINDPQKQTETRKWQMTFTPLAGAVKPLSPHPRVWRRIEKQLGFDRAPSPSFWQNLSLWKGLTASTASVALIFAILFNTLPPQKAIETQTLMLVLNDDQSRGGWLISSSQAKMVTVSLNQETKTPHNSYELWVLPPGQAPLSLGLLNQQGRKELRVPDQLSQWIRPGATLAVSLEPVGGSPTGAPTGPVLYTGKVISI